MDRQAVLEQMQLVASKAIGQDVPTITPDTRLLDELGLDSASILEVLMDLEDTLGFQIDVDLVRPEVLQTAGALADFIVQQTAED
jgi:acyl carrier protein